jgi:hypothetical protein
MAGFYLAGGSAIALHLGHRRSEDLDFFTVSKRTTLAGIKRAALDGLKDARVLAETDATARILTGGVPVDFVRYPYPLLERPERGPHGISLACLRDLAAMKLAALAKRGLRRDFWDLHVILESGLTLRDCADAYLRRFGMHEPELYHVARALTFFDDAEKDPILPQGMTTSGWTGIKRAFSKLGPSLVK